MSARRTVTVLGATGSVGQTTCTLLAEAPERFRVEALTGNRNAAQMIRLARQLKPAFIAMTDAGAAEQVRETLAGSGVDVQSGDAAVLAAAERPVDWVMAAIVGAAGLPPTLAAARAGKRVLLANKEALVMAGALFMGAVAEAGALLLPIDSEHNAIFQCLPVDRAGRPGLAGVERIMLTASGGPFRCWTAEQIAAATPEQACAHPNWSMGRKISVDSATLMNKGLELAEACWLFAVQPSQVQIVVHPQSIIHSMVQYLDGSVLAQLGNPDMRPPIAYGLGWPQRLDSGVSPLDLMQTARLDFEAPDEGRFPCLRIAREAIAAGGTAMAVCNAANEVAVAVFLEGAVSFADIPAVIERTLAEVPVEEPASLAVVEAADTAARRVAAEQVARTGGSRTATLAGS
jgi:1-deoxy-D-xylulose-5-phosphate reductoisomerase